MITGRVVKSQVKEKVLSVAKVAIELGVARITVRRWLKAKIIEGFKLPGGHYRIPRSEVHRIQAGKGEEARSDDEAAA